MDARRHCISARATLLANSSPNISMAVKRVANVNIGYGQLVIVRKLHGKFLYLCSVQTAERRRLVSVLPASCRLWSMVCGIPFRYRRGMLIGNRPVDEIPR